MMSFCEKLTDEDLICYLNKIESVGLSKAYCYSARKEYETNTAYTIYISLPYFMAARTAGNGIVTVFRFNLIIYVKFVGPGLRQTQSSRSHEENVPFSAKSETEIWKPVMPPTR